MGKVADFAEIEFRFHMLEVMGHQMDGPRRIIVGNRIDDFGMFVRAAVEAIRVTVNGGNERRAGNEVAHGGKKEIRTERFRKQQVEPAGKLACRIAIDHRTGVAHLVRPLKFRSNNSVGTSISFHAVPSNV